MNSKTLLFFALLSAFPLCARAQGTGPAVSMAVPRPMAAHVLYKGVTIRRGPGSRTERIGIAYPDTPLVVNAQQEDWSQVTLADGRVGWVRTKMLRLETVLPVAPAGQDARSVPVPSTAMPSSTIRPTPQRQSPAPKPLPANPLAGTRPDPTDTPRESPSAALGDSGKMLVYLLPVLILIVLAVRGLRGVYQHTGGLPDMKGGLAGLQRSLIGGLTLSNARRTGGSSIRVMESVPLGAFGLHLVEARGRLFLLGTSGASICRLAEFRDGTEPERSGFQSYLEAASTSMADPEDSDDGSIAAVVESLDTSIREAQETIARNAAHVRRWKDGNGNGARGSRER